MIRRIALALALAVAGAAHGQEASLVAGLARCGLGPSPAVTVAGLPRSQTVLSEAQAERLRLSVEAGLASEGARVSAARDVTRLRALQALSAEETEALLATAHSGEAVVFVVDPLRTATGLRFRLQAMTPDGACKVTSQPMETALAASGQQSLERVLDTTMADFLSDVDRVGICPLRSSRGHSPCGPALAQALMAAALEEAKSTNRQLTDQPLSVTRLDAATCAEALSDPAIYPRLSTDAQGAPWLEMDLRRGTETLAALGRTPVDLAALACDPASRPLAEFITVTAQSDRATLDISAQSFQRGALLDVRIDLGVEAPLYCWIIAPDETAFIILPMGQARPWPAARYSYPRDFGLQPIVLSDPFENFFHCFTPTAPLPEALSARWQEAAMAGGQPALLDRATITDLLDAMRAQPGVIEASARIIVR